MTLHALDMPARKNLRQSTLFNYNSRASTSTRSNPQRQNVVSPKRKRAEKLDTPDHRTASDSDDDVRAINFESKAPTSGNTRPAVKRRRIIHITDSESEVVPVRKGKSRQIRSDSSDSDSPTSITRDARTRDEVEALEEEVDKDCE